MWAGRLGGDAAAPRVDALAPADDVEAPEAAAAAPAPATEPESPRGLFPGLIFYDPRRAAQYARPTQGLATAARAPIVDRRRGVYSFGHVPPDRQAALSLDALNSQVRKDDILYPLNAWEKTALAHQRFEDAWRQGKIKNEAATVLRGLEGFSEADHKKKQIDKWIVWHRTGGPNGKSNRYSWKAPDGTITHNESNTLRKLEAAYKKWTKPLHDGGLGSSTAASDSRSVDPLRVVVERHAAGVQADIPVGSDGPAEEMKEMADKLEAVERIVGNGLFWYLRVVLSRLLDVTARGAEFVALLPNCAAFLRFNAHGKPSAPKSAWRWLSGGRILAGVPGGAQTLLKSFGLTTHSSQSSQKADKLARAL